MKRFLLSAAILICAPSFAAAQPVVDAVVNGASFTNSLAPGASVAIFGTQLAPSAALAPALPLPSQLNGVSVTIGGVSAPLLYVSTGQVNAIVPFAVGSPGVSLPVTVPLVVTAPSGTSVPFNVKLSRNAPAIFTQNGAGTGNALAFDSNLNPISSPGAAPIILYATGLGPTTPPGSTDSGGATSEPLNRVQDTVIVYAGDMPATVVFAGLAPGFPGVYQLNLVPNAPVSNRIYISENGVQSNIATLAIPAGTNTANVSGSIKGLYPPASGAVSFSEMLFAATFQVAFDILPGAKPFQVVARTQAATAVIQIDPVQSTWRATLTLPTAAEKQYSFPSQVTDFLAGRPFPGNTVPLSRIDPLALAAIALLPIQATANGALSANGHFEINSDTLNQLSSFGGFAQISQQFGGSLTTSVQLFVDGLLIASKDISFPVD